MFNLFSPEKTPTSQWKFNHGTHKAAAGLWQNTMRQLRTRKATSSLEPPISGGGFFLNRKIHKDPPIKGPV